MILSLPDATTEDSAAADTRLTVLQAAESFARWTEATLHLLAGDEVDLWARGHRLPHLG